jgi:molybdopterin molybdotransferase
VLTDGELDLNPNRARGADFRAGDRVEAPRRLRPRPRAHRGDELPAVTVRRSPSSRSCPPGDELVMPGGVPRPDQIVASNAFALKAMVEAEGAEARMLPIARDTEAETLAAAFRLAAGADLIVTIGGASVGDHDLVGAVAEAEGVERAFYKVAMRPESR